MKVIATDLFEKNNKRPIELSSVPKKGDTFEVVAERCEFLVKQGYVEKITIEPNKQENTDKSTEEEKPKSKKTKK